MSILKRSVLMKETTVLLVLTMAILSMVPPVDASFISSMHPQNQTAHDQDLRTISKALEQKMVKERLHDLGYTDQEIRDRLNQLSDQEIHDLAVQIEALEQGGVLGVIISILVIILLVILILKVK